MQQKQVNSNHRPHLPHDQYMLTNSAMHAPIDDRFANDVRRGGARSLHDQRAMAKHVDVFAQVHPGRLQHVFQVCVHSRNTDGDTDRNR